MKGFKQFSLLLCAGLVGALIGILATTQMPNLSASEEISHPHVLLAHESREATCTQTGNRAYWSCTECNTFFSDAYGLYEIKPDEFVDWITIAPSLAELAEPRRHDSDPEHRPAGRAGYAVFCPDRWGHQSAARQRMLDERAVSGH